MKLPDIESAQKEAARILADVARDMVRGQPSRHIAIEVCTQEGPVLEPASFGACSATCVGPPKLVASFVVRFLISLASAELSVAGSVCASHPVVLRLVDQGIVNC